MLWWASNDLRARRTPLALLGAIVVFSGVGRVIGGLTYGFGSRVVAWTAVGEILVPTAIWLFGGW